MLKKWLKNISILLLGLFLLVDSNMIETFANYFIQVNHIENTTEKPTHDDEPAETNPTEKVFEKSEFIVDDSDSLINPTLFSITKSYPLAFSKLWINRAISVLTPPPNLL